MIGVGGLGEKGCVTGWRDSGLPGNERLDSLRTNCKYLRGL